MVRKALKGGSFGIQANDCIWKFISLYQHTVYVGRKPAVCRILGCFHFLVQTGLWTLVLFVVFTEECKCCCTTRVQWYYIQSVTAMLIVQTCFLLMHFHILYKEHVIPIYRWRNWRVERLRGLSEISEWVRGRDWKRVQVWLFLVFSFIHWTVVLLSNSQSHWK